MILVTGGSGYIGSHIIKRFVEEGKTVRALIRNPTRAEREGRLKDLDVEWSEGDVTQLESLHKAMQGVELVIHTVAIAIEQGKATYESVNFQGTAHVVEAAKTAGIKRLINLSQLGADTTLPYRMLASKGKAQDYVVQSNLDWTAFRPSVVWGPEDEFANTFARLVPISPIIFPIIGDKNTQFQPLWVDDLAEAIFNAQVDSSTIHKEFELGGPEILTLEEIERRTLAALTARRIFIRFPLPLLRIIVSLMETFLPAPPVTGSLLELLNVSNVTTQNAIGDFISNPRPFSVENIAPYMNTFRVKDTLAQYLNR
jgi:NADH dehydrogenase